jgi:hypothetical protein
MNDSVVAKICGAFLGLSAVLGLAAGPIAGMIGYPLVVDFADAATLSSFAAAWPAPFLFCLLQLSLPTLALASGLGFYHVVGIARPILVLGVLLWSLGLVLTTAQDAIEVSLAYYLPNAYAQADETTRAALLAIGGVGGTAMNVFGRLGIVAYAGLLLINLAIWRRGGRWKLVAAAGITSVVVIGCAAMLAPLSPRLGFLVIGFPIGFILLRIWMIVMAVTMLRWRADPDAIDARASATA